MTRRTRRIPRPMRRFDSLGLLGLVGGGAYILAALTPVIGWLLKR